MGNRKYIVGLYFIMAFSNSVFADLAPSAHYIHEIEPQTDGIRLSREELYLTLHNDMQVSVEARFWLEGGSNDNVNVYFPKTELAEDKEFRVKVNDENVEVLPYEDERGYVKGKQWDIPFEGGSAYVVVTYVADLFREDDYRGTFFYSLKTGAAWTGPIGELDISIGLKGITPEDVTFINPGGYVSDDNGFSWHFEDYEPDENICIAFFRRGGFEVEKGQGYFQNGYDDLGKEACERAIEQGDEVVRKYAKYYLSRYWYYPRGEYETAVGLLASEPLKPLDEDEGPFLDSACKLESLRSELILGRVNIDDERIRKLTDIAGRPFAYHYKSIAGGVKVDAFAALLILENQTNAGIEEREFLLGNPIYRRYGGATPYRYDKFKNKFPDSELISVADYFAFNYTLGKHKYGHNLTPKTLRETGDNFAELANTQTNSLRLWSAIGAYECYILAMSFNEAIPYIEYTASVYEKFRTGSFVPYDHANRPYCIREFTRTEIPFDFGIDNMFSRVNTAIHEDDKEEYYQGFFAERILFYIAIGNRDLFDKALQDYKNLFPVSYNPDDLKPLKLYFELSGG
jgi:hypothetical protein